MITIMVIIIVIIVVIIIIIIILEMINWQLKTNTFGIDTNH